MNTLELKELLRTVIVATESVQVLRSADAQFLEVLNGINEKNLNFLLALVNINNPLVTREQLLEGIRSIKQALQLFQQMDRDGSLVKIGSLCNFLEKHTICLSILSRFL